VQILVTGATGFIGSRISQALLAAGHHVRALHRSTSSLRALADLPIEPYPGDILSPSSLEEAIAGVEAVIHCAGELGQRASRLSAEAVIASHVLGTRNVVEAALRTGVARLVYTSSVAAFGVPEIPTAGQTTPLMTESHEWNYNARLWPYGYAKHMAELEVMEAVGKGLEAVIVNPSIVIGAGDFNLASNAFILQAALHGIPVAAPGGVNVVYIGDVIQGHLAALERGTPGERYILAGDNLSIPRLLSLTAGLVGRRPPRLTIPLAILRAGTPALELVPRLLGLPIAGSLLRLAGRFFFYDSSKAHIELGLGPPKAYHLAAAEALNWFAENGYLPK